MEDNDIHKMIQCPVCGTELEPWQITCHNCDQTVSSDKLPVIKLELTDGAELEAAFKDWMTQGRDAMKRKSYDEAHACFAEALKRVHQAPGLERDEVRARKSLSAAFVKLSKQDEAIEQLVIAEKLATTKREKERLQKKIDQLNAAQDLATGEMAPPDRIHRVSSPLYCVSCSRLMAEAEVYQFRSGKVEECTCACGYTGPPVTRKSDNIDLEELLITGMREQDRKARLIEAAQKPVQGGRTRGKAFWLALLLGAFGAHKFYLGDRGRGYVYLALSWSLVPWLVAIYEAIVITQMSRVSFNLVYNLDDVLGRLPPEGGQIDLVAEDAEVLSMEISEEPDDLVDEWSKQDEV